MIKNILWDFDGVILDSMPIRDYGFKKIFENYPKELVEEFIEYHRINGGLSRFHKIKYFYNYLLNKEISEKQIQDYAEQFTIIMKEQLTNKKYLIQESVDFIKSNHQNYNFHIVSGSEHNELNYLCEKLGLAGYFLSINGSPTPKNNLVRNLLKKQNYKKEETILIGDSINDYDAANINSIKFYGFNNKELRKGRNYIEHFSEFTLNNFKVVDLSGYSFSGKSAYFDLLCEFEGYNYHSKEFEFELIRVQNGIIDLYYALVENWSPVRSSEAIRNFQKLIKNFSGDNGLLSRLFGRGYKYDYYFKDFTLHSQELIDALIIARWKSEWPFAFIDYPFYKIFIKKLLFRLGKKDIYTTNVFLSRFEKDEFLYIMREYFDKLFFQDDKNKALIVNNAFETTNPIISHRFFYSAKSIIVDRDPRDIYLSALKTGYVNGINVGKTAIGKNVENFIDRFKLYRKNLISDENVLRINFEDLVLNYEKTLIKLFIFLGEDKSIHKYPKKYFNPEVSKKGVGMWKNVDGQLKKDVDKIYSELKEYCVNI